MAELHGFEIALHQAERDLYSVDPSARLMWPRVLRRVIREERSVSPLGRIPDLSSYVISGSRLLQIVAPDEIGVALLERCPETVILLRCPEETEFQGNPGVGKLNGFFWRLLFHARVLAGFQAALSGRKLSVGAIRQRIDQIGQVKFDEIRAVLLHEARIEAADDLVRTYVEFVATYLELRHFAPESLRSWFPSLDQPEKIEELISLDVQGQELFERTRLPGAEFWPPLSQSSTESPPVPTQPLGQRKLDRLIAKAKRCANQGNLVRAAILCSQAEQGALSVDHHRAKDYRTEAMIEIAKLVSRLQNALGFPQTDEPLWIEALLPMLPYSISGFWNPVARMLYDLQKACVDAERDLYVVDVFGWIASLGKFPIKRSLPNQRVVLVVRSLRTALHRLRVARVKETERERLRRLLTHEVHRIEERTRLGLRPTIQKILDDCELVPGNLPERIARDKLVEELLDEVTHRGFISMGRLRDIISQNDLKFPDVITRERGWQRDQLLHLDKLFNERLDGAYDPGPFYIRLFQWMSGIAFGTVFGRLLTLRLLVPYGGAFLILFGIQEGPKHPLEWVGIHYHVHVFTFFSMAALGAFLQNLIESAKFRTFVRRSIQTSFDLIRGVADLPTIVLRWPLLRWFFHSLVWRGFRRYLLSPIFLTVFLGQVLPLIGFYDRPIARSQILLLVTLVIVLNSRLERDIEELTYQWIERKWHEFRVRVLIALFDATMETFKRILDGIDKILYAVDEWLRFRGGNSQGSLIAKAILGMLWKVINFVIRFCVTLIIEPQVNPIKHFPVVTVSHKIFLTQQTAWTELFQTFFGRFTAETLSWLLTFSLPGVCGFMVWEFTENWKLFTANRRKNLAPIRLGHHGETMLRLLKPGFHSGTLPKIFNRLRRAERIPDKEDRETLLSQGAVQLDEAIESITHFIDRFLIALLKSSPSWNSSSFPAQGTSSDSDPPEFRVEVESVRLTSNTISVTLKAPRYSTSEEPVRIVFAEQSGWLVAQIEQSGWIHRLTAPQKKTFRTALIGLYKLCGVDLCREHLSTCLVPQHVPYDIADQGLVLWPGRHYVESITYELQTRNPLQPRPRVTARKYQAPILFPEGLFMSLASVSWETWVDAWKQDTAETGAGWIELGAADMSILPNATPE